jgi:hypothetical protein
MARLSAALQAARELGPGPLVLYASYRFRLRSGWLRRQTPASSWPDRPLSSYLRPDVPSDPLGYFAYRQDRSTASVFGVGSERASQTLGDIADPEAAVAEADEIACGRFRLFGGPPVGLGFPPDWSTFASLDTAGRSRVELDRHWTAYSLEALPDDVKLLWEPSRFGWVFRLARAYELTHAGRYATTFWTLVDSWRSANDPNTGLHWASAQEVALRLMALTFGMHVFGPGLSVVQTATLAQMIAVHAERIPPTLGYARAQNNNHLLAEAAGLLTVGVLFPEFQKAAQWRRLGTQAFVAGLTSQVFDDGSYIQHSTNYHRLALQLGLWTARVLEGGGEPLPERGRQALVRLTQALGALTDPTTGEAPNFGPNDGALFLALTASRFGDHRPTVQAASRLFLDRPAYPPGPWDELGAWLGLGRLERRTPHSFGRSTSLPQGGLSILEGPEGRGVLRCVAFRSRPGHSDQLHLDLWRRGQAIARDAGTYHYSGQGVWDNGLSGATVHNTLILDGQDPMRRAGRFLWLNWAQGRVLGRWSVGDGLEAIAAAHDGYRRQGAMHRRTVVRAGNDTWLVVDDILGRGRHRATMGWLLPDRPWSLLGSELSLELEAGRVAVTILGVDAVVGLYRAGELIGGSPLQDAGEAWGWYSPTYALREPGLRFAAQITGPAALRLVTCFAFDGLGSPVSFLPAKPGGVAALEWVEAGDARLTW